MKLKDLPAINFATADAQTVLDDAVKIVEGILGRTLERADPLRLFLDGLIAIIIQQRLLIDHVAKMNLLAYSTGDYLEHLGILVGCERLGASNAVTTVEVNLSAPRATSTTIRKGTRITADDNIFFALDDDVIFAAGEVTKTCKATCTATGEGGNGYAAGELCKIVDPQPFLQSITNITTSEGGADIETDDALRERIHEAAETFSCAGSEGAYIARTKEVSQLIVDVAVDSDLAGNVQVYPLLKGGTLPGDELLQAVDEHLNSKTIRPLTDNVSVLKPAVAAYDFNVTYYVARSNAVQAAAIVEQVELAAQNYLAWQCAKLGRDINPDELIHRLKVAGVKRAVISSPSFTPLTKIQVAQVNNFNLQFAGLEDD